MNSLRSRIRSMSVSGPRSAAVRSRRRGAAIAYVAVSSTVLIGFSALSIDLGRMYMARTELQRCADAAAMAGASAYTVASLLSPNIDATHYAVATPRCQETSLSNLTFGSPTNLAVADILLRFYDFNDPDSMTGLFKACRVNLRCDGNINGNVPFTFGTLFGQTAGNILTTATAVFDTRVAGFTPGAGVMVPLTIRECEYQEQFEQGLGTDEWAYDAVTGPIAASDTVPEIHLFPDTGGGANPNNGNNGNNPNANDVCGGDNDTFDGAGNFGLLNIGIGNAGVPPLGEQIHNGVPPEALQAETGSPELLFGTPANPQTYQITGNPGISGGVEPDLQYRVGTVIGFFLYDWVDDGGGNAVYNITGLRFGRLMHVDLTGNDKEVVVQPVVYSGPGLRLEPTAEPIPGSTMGRIVLVN